MRDRKIRMNYYLLSALAAVRGEDPSRYKKNKFEYSWRPLVDDKEHSMIKTLKDEGFFSSDDWEIEYSENAMRIFDKQTKSTKLIPRNANGAEELGLDSYYSQMGERVSLNGQVDVVKEMYEEAENKKRLKDDRAVKQVFVSQKERIEHLEALLSIREATADIDIYSLDYIEESSSKDTISISLLSDIHIDEVVKPESVMNLNKYNPDIAKDRIDRYFMNLVKLVAHHQRNYQIRHHVIGVLGDIIGGYIHPELEQTNSMSPLEGIRFAKECLISGLKYVNDNMDVERIDVVCVVGNHGRTTKKLQFGNMLETSYEYFLYEDLKDMCEKVGLDKIHFHISKSSSAIIELFGKNYMFVHGNQWKYASGIGGVVVPFMRYFGRISPMFNIERIFFGHWHTTVDIKRGVGNGSIKGYDAYALNHGLEYEPPQQSMVLLNKKRGFTNFQSIYLD